MNAEFKYRFFELKKKMLEKEFSKMNDKQLEAVFHVNGPIMILAGAGSGKTTVIVNRIANMIKYGNAYNSENIPFNLSEDLVNELEKCLCEDNLTGDRLEELLGYEKIQPWNILAITFTNKAANELKERILSIIPDGRGADVWASTFHSTCARILRMNADRIGYTNHFAIYDKEDTKRLIKDCQKSLQIDEKILTAKSISYEISSAKDKLMSPKDFKLSAINGENFRIYQVSDVYEEYQKRLESSDSMDFDDLILNTVKLFKECPDVLEKYQDKFKYILVDEFQDTNHAQNELINMLAEKNGNLCIVGDDDQSIYKFRGATIENIINFEKNHTGTKVIRLEQNYRSTKNILNAANSVIENNQERKGKNLWTENPEGEKISVHTAYSEHDESNFIVRVIKEGIENGLKYSDFAILYRMNSQSNVIEKAFIKSGIPYRLLGGVRFYERKEVKDMLAYLSIVNNPSDEVRLRRIINQPRRSIGERTVAQAAEIARNGNTDLFEVISNATDYENLQRVANKLEAFSSMIQSFITAYKDDNISLRELYQLIIDKTEYEEFLKSDKDDYTSRIANVEELRSNIIKYEEDEGENATLSGFLEEVSLLTDIDNYDENSDCTVMMTVHSAKGLEFPVVFLPGFEEGIFPGPQAEFDEKDREEERRLSYVAITRAKQKLYLLNSDGRMLNGSTVHNKHSGFIDEIPEDLIEKTKSRDWKKMDPNDEKPQLAQEIRAKSAIAARHFGQISAGVANVNVSDLIIGDVVKHGKFGTGRIISSINMGNDSMLEIDFDNVGTKKLMKNFAGLEKQN